MHDIETLENIEKASYECREMVIEMLHKAGSGHPGGSFSAQDIITTLYLRHLRWDKANPLWEERDRFILSKGHAVPALYAILARQGALPKEELSTFRQINSRLQGHPDRVAFPSMEASTGSLGQGLSIAQGIAMALKQKGSKAKVYCLLGDGESQEGQIWETAMSAPKFKLDNLIVFLDNNNGQIDGTVEEVMNLGPIGDKWRAFNWSVQEIDGHNIEQIDSAIEKAKNHSSGPSMIVCRTVKGKGVSFMENNIGWHGKAPNAQETEAALKEIREKING